jgi:D-inositol-3-phosphate glycosyltransferase
MPFCPNSGWLSRQLKPEMSITNTAIPNHRSQLGSRSSQDRRRRTTEVIEDREPSIKDQEPNLSTRNHQLSTSLHVALLTGGDDKPYVLGLVSALTSIGVNIELIGSDEVSVPELLDNPHVKFLNLRGDQKHDAPLLQKVLRITKYYWRLLRYAAVTNAAIFHVLWNNKFELFDRTLLLVYYKLLGRKITMTAHNVNMRKRDGTDTWLNRSSLWIQYRLVDYIFVHAEANKAELLAQFGVAERKVSVIPFGINNTVPHTGLGSAEAKKILGILPNDKVVLHFGQIAPYKGLEYLVTAFRKLLASDPSYRLIIAGKPKWDGSYWSEIAQLIGKVDALDRVIQRIEHIPDSETEIYFKAADVLVLPYRAIFHSGVMFLAYSFGLPVVGADVGALKDEIIQGQTGLIFKPCDSADLAAKIDEYFASDLFRNLQDNRLAIKEYANKRYSWDKVAAITTTAYEQLLVT